MFLQRGPRVLRKQLLAVTKTASAAARPVPPVCASVRRFTESRRLLAVKPVILADIGEGIVECEVIQWFVEPGAVVEEFSPLCEVQSDKASVEITSRFTGTVKKLHYDAGEMARVGKPFIDIDIQDGAKQADIDALTESATEPQEEETAAPPIPPPPPSAESREQPPRSTAATSTSQSTEPQPKGRYAALATPAVRHLSKELKVDITDINGTGKDGRVLKEDIYNYVKARHNIKSDNTTSAPALPTSTTPARTTGEQTETTMPLSHTQQQMFKTMTRSLTIPHFLYADEIDFSHLVELRSRLNRVLAKSRSTGTGVGAPTGAGAAAVAVSESEPSKLSYLPFIIKAVSLALYKFPILNARVDTSDPGGKPALVHRSQHNIGVAMDTPQGLVVPVIRDVGSLNVLSIAAELSRLQGLAQQSRLAPRDLTGGTITVSNIGNIGGTYLSPVIVEREVAILGIGRMRTVPAFDENGKVVKKQVCNFSWSADHRVVDGATMARAADVVRAIVEEPDVMTMHLR